ncbi:MAG: putative DNA-binding domain-containing protein [Myxococcales bacterium]|nr:putative DNA-binding domain-containing protein [Myxococcales bacterium]
MAERPQDLQVIDAFTAALREVDASAAISRDLAAFYAAHGLEGATLTAMVERGASRLKMYRAMVQGRLRRVIREFIPRTAARLGRPRYDADFAAFFAEAGSHSVVLRDVPVELVTWAAPRWRADPEIPDYLVDLARHELVAAEVRNAPGGREPPTGEALALGRPSPSTAPPASSATTTRSTACRRRRTTAASRRPRRARSWSTATARATASATSS